MKLKEQKINKKQFKRSEKHIGEGGCLLGSICFLQNYMHIDSILIAN